MNYYLGVDIGTTSSKAVAFSATGEILSQYSAGYDMMHPQTGWCEQSPDEILQAVVSVINRVQNELAPAQPALISFSAAMHSLLLVNKTGDPVTNSIIWADSRAVEIAAELRNSPRGPAFYRVSGVPVQAMSPLCKLLWFKKNSAYEFEQAHKFIGIKEYIFSRIFGEYAVDTAIAAATGLLNLDTLQWDENILSFAGLEKSKLSEVVNVKKIFYYNKQKLHPSVGNLSLPEKTVFVIGGSDGALANIGTGAVDKHSMVITIGTSSAARIITDKPGTDPAMRTFCYHAKDNSYIIGGASNNGAVVLQWLAETLLQTHESLPTLFKLAKNIPAGSDGLLFLPYILGERAPIWDSYAKGNFFGVTINHTKAHMVRSVMEGVIYSVYSIGKILMEKNPSIEIYATGGFANSPLWLQILADVCNCRVLVSGSVESSAMGAVVVGLESLNLPPLPANKILSVHEPDSTRHEIYQVQFRKFERIYELLKDEFKNDTIPVEKDVPVSVDQVLTLILPDTIDKESDINTPTYKMYNLNTKIPLLIVFLLAINGMLIAQKDIEISTIKIDSGYFKSFDDTRIYYEVSGDGEPILLVHGFIVNSSNWKKTSLYADLLKSHFKVIMLDLRGNGKSDHPHVADAYASDAEAKDIMGLLKFLHIANYKAVGYSRGSIITARLLVLDKNLIKGVLGGMGTGFTDPNWDRPRQIYEALSGKNIAEFEPMKENIRKNGLDSVALAYMQLHQPATLPSALAKLDKPVLIISGDQDNFSSAEALSKMIRNSELVSVPGTHNTASSTAAFSEAVVKFLKGK